MLWFHCGFRTGFRQTFEICGSKKFLIVDDLVLPRHAPTKYILKSSSLTKYDLITEFDEQHVVEETSKVGPVQVSTKIEKVM